MRTAVIYIDDPNIVTEQIKIIEEKKSFINDQLAELNAFIPLEDEAGKTGLIALQKKWEIYNALLIPLVENIQTTDIELTKVRLNNQLQVANDFVATADEFDDILREQAQATAVYNTAIYESSRLFLLGLILVAILVGLSLAFFTARAISRAARQMAAVAEGISKGELDYVISVKSKDEMGEMATAFNHMVAYLQDMASTAEKIAAGDLMEDVQPQSENDVLGTAFARMIVDLRQTIGQVAGHAASVELSSGQLSATADQAEQATSQIASTIQQVAQGIAQQMDSVISGVNSIEQLTRAIDGVAKGAQAQATAVTRSSEVTLQLSTITQQVADNARAGAAEAAQAAQTARTGAKTIEETIQRMGTIKAKVGTSAQKVQQMGRHSEQIGDIIETIDNIASQTNLLALNAAIEAARAGEHGKGFAVVADEVRKLAEQSAVATKEIAKLIKGIQQTVAEATHAMGEGVTEVECGTARADEAAQALTAILRAVEVVSQQVKEISSAAEHMSTSSGELVSVVDTMAVVVEENAAATEKMAANSKEVSQIIENMASMSEENSAAVEEVSASTEEMTAQVEEVTTSAQSLSHMAQAMRHLVEQFKLSKGPEEIPNSPTLRAMRLRPQREAALTRDNEQSLAAAESIGYRNGKH
jgi:methyl-accepting chemotaxis protein